MGLFAAAIYWVIIALWLVVLGIICVYCVRNPRTLGTTRLLLVVLVIDTLRNVVENTYFGLYFGAQFGVFPSSLVGVMSNPNLLIIPKIINVFAASAVIGVLLLKWLPESIRERRVSEETSKLTSDALAVETEENRRLFETSADLIFVADRDRVIRRVSGSCRQILGYEPSEIEGNYGGKFVAPSDLKSLQLNIQRLARDGKTLGRFQTNFIHKDGRVVTLAMTGVWSKDVRRFFVFGRDTTERKAAELELIRLAHFDHLTGVPNRTSLRRDLDALSARSLAANPRYSVVSLDLDGFKEINDTRGHSTGDAVLQQVAQRLQSAISGAGNTYRMGGDEFLIVFPDCQDPLEIGHHVDRVLEAISCGIELGGNRLDLGASAGIAIATKDNAKPDDILADADLALYEAKAAGGRKYRLFHPSMRAKAAARQELDHELRWACINREFVLHYQPQLRMSDNAVVGAEALLRWQHPQRGLLAPSAFIEALAASPSALEVGNWILRSACETAAGWRAQGLPPIRIGVNLFPAQFHDVMLLQDVEDALKRSGLPASALELEITENIALDDDKAMLASLHALRRIGVGLAFDDFGTGYASLSFLTRFPLTRLKIDRSFVQRIQEDSLTTDSAIVRAIILMAHSLDFEVIAEGVENELQASLLRSKRCDEVQGYLYSKPLTSREFEAFVQNSLASDSATGDAHCVEGDSIPSGRALAG